MKHLGDITKISGYDVPPVDVVCGGSPCQDLSVAGKRAGLAGERSGLYMEQIRIVKEMREADVLRGRAGEFVRPRWMVWENVPGAFSSNGGEDFGAVIEEIIKVCEPDAGVQVCVPDKRWSKSGCYYSADGRWSIAWRVHDAQFWGVPQRRKRIALVADFGGLSAPEVLFERKGLSWHSEQSGEAGQGTPRRTVIGPHGTSEIAGTLDAHYGNGPGERGGQERTYLMQSPSKNEQESLGGKGILIQPERTGALSTLNNQSVLRCAGFDAYNQASTGDVSMSLTAIRSDPHHVPCVEVEQTKAYNIGGYYSKAWQGDNPYAGVYETDVTRTLDSANCGSPAANQGGTAIVEIVNE